MFSSVSLSPLRLQSFTSFLPHYICPKLSNSRGPFPRINPNHRSTPESSPLRIPLSCLRAREAAARGLSSLPITACTIEEGRMARFSLGLLLLLVVAAVARAELVNRSASAGLFWSTAKDEADLVRVSDPQEDPTAQAVNEQDGLDGGFPSLDGMLQWAIGHSDPEKLKETAQDVQRMSASDLKRRQMELKELMEKLKMPSDAQLMQIAIDDLKNSSLPLEDRHRALRELLILVEPIDNANDLPKIGGLAVVIRELDHPDPDVRKLSAWVLGKASQNNPLIQRQVLELGALAKLMMMVKSEFVEEATKALYAVSALIRNNLAGQELFYAQAGDLMLQDILSNSSIDIRLRRKAVFLVGDLVERRLEASNEDELPFFSNKLFLKAVVDLMASSDLDLQEKALTAVKNLLHLRSTQALIFKEFCGLDAALESMRQQLEDLMAEEFQRDYAMDVESLRSKVELIYQRKLGKGMQVPT